MKIARAVLRRLVRIAVMTLVVGLVAATMIRLGPGFATGVEVVDPSLSPETKAALQAERMANSNIPRFYLNYLRGMLRGDLGISQSFAQPVSRLIAERLPVTLGSLAYGAGGGIALGLGLALATVFWRNPQYGAFASALSGISISLPSALIALLFLWAGANGRWAVTLVVFPYVYRYAKNLLAAAASSQHVVTAMAKGLSAGRVLWAHILAPTLPQIAALAGISVTLAFGASIPIEVICDSPGIGQLAWQAATGRDLPLLVGITLLVAVVTMTVNSLADVFLEAGPGR